MADNYESKMVAHGHLKICENCGDTIEIKGNRRYCKQEENPSCYHERFVESLGSRQYLKYTGHTKESFIEEFGIEAYKSTVLSN